MFPPNTYATRRKALIDTLSTGLILFAGNDDSPMNCPGNPYPFRQDSSFLYYFGITVPGLMVVIDVESGEEVLYGDDSSLEEGFWHGSTTVTVELAATAGISRVKGASQVFPDLKSAITKGRRVHFLPPYRPENVMKLQRLTGIIPDFIAEYASIELIRAVVAQRSIKTAAEVAQIETALEGTCAMHTHAMGATTEGVSEMAVAAQMEAVVRGCGAGMSYPSILTCRGDILHNHPTEARLAAGDLIINDSGANSPLHYASDITRTYPVSGRFSAQQRDIYAIVLAAQENAIASVAPGIPYRQIHLQAARHLAEGLRALGILKGDPADAVVAGAHALFFPHGLGHMLGLDVHDMEDLGEDNVGYTEALPRDPAFGIRSLRLARELEPGFVLTVEPGLYFIEALIDRWESEGRHTDFIDYGAVRSFRGFGGVRIEDDVLVETGGGRVLGPVIPKTVAAVEATCSM